MVTNFEIISFVRNKTAVGNDIILPDTDIFSELACTGDDFHELIGEFADKYTVDMSSYLWYFHSDEEGGTWSLGSIFSKPPYQRVQRIPVTPQMLADYANSGRWSIKYPRHKLAKHRFDIWINWLLVLIVLFFVIKSCVK